MSLQENKDSANGSLNTMADIKVIARGIEKFHSNLNPHQAADPDQIKPIILKSISATIYFFQKSLDSGVLPSDWKDASVAPVHKKGDRSYPASYRPISLTCIFRTYSCFFYFQTPH